MSKIKCIVLDGWHKGHVVDVSQPLQTLSLMRPPVLTFDYCRDGEQVAEAPKGREYYKLAGYSVDRTTALYSIDGSIDSLWKTHTWVVPIDKNWVEQEIHVGYHDPRAVFVQPANPTNPELTNGE